MGYRDELDAARARIVALERELQAERDRSAALEREIEAERKALADLGSHPSRRDSAPSEPPRRRASARLRGIHYHPPSTYFPFLRLFVKSVEAAWVRRPALRARRRVESDSVMFWVFYYGIAFPITYAVRLPLYFLAMCILLPWTLAVCGAASVVAFPIVVLSRLSFSPEPPRDETGWWHGDPTVDNAANFMWVIESFTLIPLLLVTTSLLTASED